MNRSFFSKVRRAVLRGQSIAAAIVIVSLGMQRATGEVTMPAIFGDHMVLQEGVLLPVWGMAAPGETVTVSVGDHTGQATADSSGAWMVKLNPLPANGQPVDVQVTGSNTLVFHDVLIGDVWICSGQSNMAFGIGNAHNASQAISNANNPQIRLFVVPRTVALTPQADCGKLRWGMQGQWLVCSPNTVTLGRAGWSSGGWLGFSAIGYFFGSEVQQDRQVPIGLIETNWGGTRAECWMSLEALQANPALTHYADSFVQTRDNLAQAKIDYDTKTLPAWQQAHDAWQQQYGPAYDQAMQQWKDQAAAALKAGQSPSQPPPHPGKPEPKKPVFIGDSPFQPTVLFNAMINPLIPYGIKGVIWYQGESNGTDLVSCREYATLFPALISDWRQRWSAMVPSLAQFPFLYVQLASYGWSDAGFGTYWPYLRAAQTKTLALPNTGMAVTIDIGEYRNIHPKDKLDVGHRLALLARRVAYGEGIVASGPTYDSMTLAGNKIVVSFRKADGNPDPGASLVIGVAPPIRLGLPPAVPADSLQGFVIAGADGKFVPAQAKIDGDTVVIWSDQVAQPTAVRYDWSGYPVPTGNLYNQAGLPASPFATDVKL
jgi:sialate O-acetylesterase